VEKARKWRDGNGSGNWMRGWRGEVCNMQAPGGWLTLAKWGVVAAVDYGVGVRLPRSVSCPRPPPRAPGWGSLVGLG
jgi:hypothetical protein